jgi:hypothetical protein
MHTIGLIPLDERPVNTRYPAMIAAIAGAEVRLPSAELLSVGRTPAAAEPLVSWLHDTAPKLDGLIVSCEMLGYGGLIASRIGDEPAATVLARLDALRDLRRRYPQLPIYGFNVITRVSNADDAIEEPLYWAEYGTALYQLSQLLDRRGHGETLDTEIAALEERIPAAHRRDFLLRRLRNHSVNLAVLHMLAEGVFDLLVLSSDDTSPFGLPSREKGWLAGWGELLFETGGQGDRGTGGQGDKGTRGQGDKGTGGQGDKGTGGQGDKGTTALVTQDLVTHDSVLITHHSSLLMYPGADEVGCVLLARMLNRAAGVTPNVSVQYAPAEAADNVAAYEDGPICRTVERQLEAAGCVLAPNRPDNGILLGVNAPLAHRGEWTQQHAAADISSRATALDELAAAAQQRIAAGQAVALADVAYPNGADPALIERLCAIVDLPNLTGYGAWNTAGNTIGTLIAQACAVQLGGAAGRAAHEHFLLHRFVEDWGYQQRVRAEVRNWLQAEHGVREPNTPELTHQTSTRIEAGLNAAIDALPGFAGRYRIAPGSVRLPWGRTFEVDFDLEERSWLK